MGSTFSSYEIARSGMYVSERGLFVTGHNISNVNTPGYVRQQSMQEDFTPSKVGNFQIGLGADIQQIRQIRFQFLDTMYRAENEILGYASAKQQTVEDLEAILGDFAGNEKNGQALGRVIDEFFEAWDELSKAPDTPVTRAMVRQTGIIFADTVNHLGQQIDELQDELNMQVKEAIDRINTIATEISELNFKIMKSEAVGDQANDYRDQRNLLLDELTGLVNVDIHEKPNSIVCVSIGGIQLVSESGTEKMKVAFNAPNSYFYTAKWERTDSLVQLRNGRLKGLMDARGNVAAYEGSAENGSPLETADVDTDAGTFEFKPNTTNLIPELKKGLNMLISLFTRKVNAMHRNGLGVDGSTGIDFFTRIDDTLPFEMGNIQVNAAFDGDDGLNKIAAAGTGNGAENNTVARMIADFRDASYFKNGQIIENIGNFYVSVSGWLGTNGQEVKTLSENQKMIMEQIQNKREAVSGVSMDEEMTNMMKYQHAYNASARVINAVDEMIDKIVNQMGIVGR